MSNEESKKLICTKCGGQLLEEDDYLNLQRFKRTLAVLPFSILICSIWSPIFCFIRLIIGNGFTHVEGALWKFLLLTFLSKVIVGFVIGVIIGIIVGIWRGDVGMFMGTVIGVLAAFFIAHSDVLPLRSAPEFRWDVIITSLTGAILLAATGILVDMLAQRFFSDFIGKDIKSEDVPVEY